MKSLITFGQNIAFQPRILTAILDSSIRLESNFVSYAKFSTKKLYSNEFLYKSRYPQNIYSPVFLMLVRSNEIQFGQKFHTSSYQLCEEETVNEPEKKKYIDPVLDRRRVIPVEMSIKYLKSKAYKTTYGDEPVWVPYRRNFKGRIAPKLTRYSCILEGRLVTGNPCPICRDEYLVVNEHNIDLIKQFISPYTNKVMPFSKTNICQTQQLNVEVAVERARNLGLLTFWVPFREYNYDNYKPKVETEKK